MANQIPNVTLLDLEISAASNAVEDAGLDLHQIDGLITWNDQPNPRHHVELCEILGLHESPFAMTIKQGGASAGFSVEIATQALKAGRAKYILVMAGNLESVAGRTSRGSGVTDHMALLTMHYPDYEHPYGPLMVSFYAAVAQRHMFEFGTTEEQLAGVSVAMRYNASLNPQAIFRKPISVRDVMTSKMISSPLRLLNCCMVSDGAVAFVLTTEKRSTDCRRHPVLVLGCGSAHAGYFSGFLAKGGARGGYDLVRTIASRAADSAFAQAGIDRREVDFLTLCDNFSITPIVLIEDFGFCRKGDGGPFVGQGDSIKVGGHLPINPHGGLLSCSHAGTNFLNYVEAVVQLRHEAGARQVAGARLALASSSAGIASTHSVTILARA